MHAGARRTRGDGRADDDRHVRQVLIQPEAAEPVILLEVGIDEIDDDQDDPQAEEHTPVAVVDLAEVPTLVGLRVKHRAEQVETDRVQQHEKEEQQRPLRDRVPAVDEPPEENQEVEDVPRPQQVHPVRLPLTPARKKSGRAREQVHDPQADDDRDEHNDVVKLGQGFSSSR